jgi:hypothetical protein
LSGTRLELYPSWSLAAAILVLHAAAAACAILTLGSIIGYVLGGALLALGLAAAWARALHGARDSLRALELSPTEIVLELKSGRRMPVELAERRHVSRFLVTLSLRRPARRTILVTRDMLEAEEFRRLRLFALWGRLPKVAAKQLLA